MTSPISIVYSHNFGFNAVLMHVSGTEIRHDNKVQQVLTQRLKCDNSHKDLISPGDHFAIHEAVKDQDGAPFTAQRHYSKLVPS